MLNEHLADSAGYFVWFLMTSVCHMKLKYSARASQRICLHMEIQKPCMGVLNVINTHSTTD